MISPDVLVVIPVYNAEDYVGAALESLLNQTYKSFLIFIVNDGSTDNSERIIKTYFSERTVYIQQKNQGPGSAMNLALDYARDHKIDLIARADADDISMPDRLEKQVALLNGKPQAAACSSNCFYIDSKTEAIIGSSTVSTSEKLIRWEINRGLRGLIQGASVFRTTALVNIGGYRLHFKGAEETDVFLRLNLRYELCNSGDFLVKIRYHDDSYSIENSHRNTLYHFYALDCVDKRRHKKAEVDFDTFTSKLSWMTKFNIKREETFLKVWRLYLLEHKIQYLLASSVMDPQRIIFRILRKITQKISWMNYSSIKNK